MKIGFIGNVNNYPYLLAKILKNNGFEVIFFVDDVPEDKLHRPENHVFKEPFPYANWIKETIFRPNILRAFFPLVFAKKLIRELNSCDAVVLNGLWHGLKPLLNPDIPSVSVFSGSDLDVFASYQSFYQFFRNHPKTRFVPDFLLKKFADGFVSRHRRGISQACCFTYFPKGAVPSGDALLEEIFPIGSPAVRFNHCHVITEQMRYVPPPNNAILKIANVARFVWVDPLPHGMNAAENKRNDIMIEGIADFLQQTHATLDIHFVEKGIHVPETKILIQKLGFSHMVTWHKELTFMNFMELLATSDIIFEQLGSHVFTGGLYPMLLGRPVIANGRLDVFNPITKYESPLCQASTPKEVTLHLLALYNNPTKREEIGVKSRQYVLDNFDIKDEAFFIAKCLQENIR